MKLTKEQIEEWINPSDATKERRREMERQRENARHEQAMDHFLRERERMERRNLIRDLFGI